MKKFLILSFLISLFCLAGCRNRTEDETTIYVVATHVPHSEILEECRADLLEKGYKLVIDVVDKYSIPNPAVAKKSADINFFQHLPFLDLYNSSVSESERLVNVANVHIEPIGLYSPSNYGYTSVSDIKDGDKIIMSRSEADHGRLLKILESAGLIELKENVSAVDASLADIVKYNVNITIDASIDASNLVLAYKNNQAPVILINGNYALAADIDPLDDAFFIESAENNPYVNVLACLEESKDLPKIKALIEVITSEKIKSFINTKYEGSVIPA